MVLIVGVLFCVPQAQVQAQECGGVAFSTGTNAEAFGTCANASGEDSTAVGEDARATGLRSTALGQGAIATGSFSTALGQRANATGSFSTAVGSSARATGTKSTAVGRVANATGPASTALGHLSNAEGTSSTALGQDTRAGSFSTAVGSSARATGTKSTAVGRVANATGSASTALGHLANATGKNSTALGQESRASGLDSIAIGRNAIATGINSIAIGVGASVRGEMGIAIGKDVSANANQIRIGNSTHTDVLIGAYNLSSFATKSGTEFVPQRLRDESTASTAISAETTARTTTDTALRNDLGTRTDTAATGGTAFAQIRDIKDTIAAANTAELTQMNLLARTDAISEVMAANTAGDTITINTSTGSVTLVGDNVREQFESLVTSLVSPGGALVDRDGNPVNTTLGEFRELGKGSGGSGTGIPERDEYLFRALYGDPADSTPTAGSIDSDTPHADSIVGRAQQGVLRTAGDVTNNRNPDAGYSQAPDIGEGASAPEASEDRRLVVEDRNEDGSISLRTVSLDSAGGGIINSRDVEKNSSGVAMAMAMQMPSISPGKRIGFGLGSGTYNKEYAAAASFAMRTHENVQFSTGIGWETGDDTIGGRIGVMFEF